MGKKRLIIELGMGTEIHGQDMTRAAEKAVRDAMSRVCIGVGLKELFNLTGHNDVILEVLIACPHPEEVDPQKIREILMSNKSDIKIVKGGMLVKGHLDPFYDDRSDEIIVANAAITILIDTDEVTLQK